MSSNLSNDEIKSKKLSLKKEIEQLSSKTDNPSSIRLKNGEPYVHSQEYQADLIKIERLVKEFNSLIESFDVASATLKKSLSFSDGRYTIKFDPQRNKWNFFDGSEYKSSDVRFSENGEEAKVYVQVCNSDTHGERVNYIYTFKTASTPDPVVEKAAPIPCDKITEGVATLRQDNDAYMKSLGFVFDTTYKRYRRPSPEEYCATLKSAKKEPEKKKSGFGLGSFLGKGNKESKERLRR